MTVQQFPIYVAHSPKMRERREFMESQFERHQIKEFEFVTDFELPEIKSRRLREIKLNRKLKNILRGKFFAINDGEFSLFLKHLEIYRRIIKHNQPFALVLEDDAVFSEDFNLQFRRAIEVLPQAFDFLFLNEEIYLPDTPRRKLSDFNDFLQQATFGKTSVSFVISKNACEKALESAFPISLPIDHYHNFIIQKYNLKTFWVKEGFVKNGSLKGLFKSGLDNKK
jgi:GR25 family glycosyltransferase involved in LPS biosynthesis